MFLLKNKFINIFINIKFINDILFEINKYCFQFKLSVLKVLFNRKYFIYCDI